MTAFAKTIVPKTADEFVNEGREKLRHGERTVRVTVDLPIALHKRVRLECVVEGKAMSEVIRALVYKRFPEK